MATQTQSLAEKYKNILSKSKTAYNPGSKPTASDISAQQGLMKAKTAEDTAQSEKLKQELYGEQTLGEGATKQKSYLQGALHTLGAPLYTIVGSVEALLGKGTKKGIENIPANIEEEGCYDNKTEVLTDNGWKFFKSLTYDDKIATLNPTTNFLEYQVIKLLVKYSDKKNLVVIKNRSIDIAVTENHNMWVSALSMKNKKSFYRPYSFIEAIELPNTIIKVKRTCLWEGEENGKAEDWFAFMGIYLAEGCLSSHKKSIFLAVKKEGIKIKVRKLLQRLKFKYSERKDGCGFEIFGEKELVEEVKKLGLSYEKYIPKLIKFSTTDKISIFLEWFGYGDSHYRNGWREFYSSSQRLINDLQECLVKVGKNGNINIRDRRGIRNWFRNHWIIGKQLSYELNERVKKTDSFISGWRDIHIEKYNGDVYCAEVENHIMLVRRNGKAYFCGNTFGDLLRSYGVSNLVSAPLGIALDIAGDPLNWATAGTAALVPRVGYGAIKGGLTGAKVGLESGLLTKGEKLGRIVPGLVKNAFSETPEIAGKGMATSYRNLSKKAADSTKLYEDITGVGVNKALAESATKVRVLDRLENWLNQRSWGQTVNKMFAYSPREGLAATRREDLANLTKTVEEPSFGGLLGKDAKETVNWAKNPSSSLPRNSLENDIRFSREANNDMLQRQMIQKEMANLESGILAGDEKALNKLSALSESEKNEFLSVLNYYKAEVSAYDKKIAQALLSPAGRKTLKSYALFISAFKNAKIGGGLLSSGTNAMIGNPVMTAMFGGDITNPGLYKSLGQAIKIARGKDYRPILDTPEILEYMEKSPLEFTRVFGVYPTEIKGGGQFIDRSFNSKVINEAKRMGKNFNLNDEDNLNKVLDETLVRTKQGAESINNTIANYLNRGVETSMISTEVLRGPMGDLVKNLKTLADQGNPLANIAHWYLTVPLEYYSKIDQSWKLTTLLHYVKNGITSDELIKMAKRVPISHADVKQIPGRNVWKMTPSKAAEIANEMYMDYLAMPGFVKIMRTLPILGSPFASFAYGMMSQATKAAVYNPSVFNKVNYFMKEVTGQRSPLEKEALSQPYYQWYSRPGMLKIPFFEENPVYLNMANMLPYYTMNIFQPAERDYKSKVGNAVAGIVDKSPFLKTPEGQVIFDYLIQPMILQGEQPKGMFNQPLWSSGDTAIQKVGKGVQTVAESLMPTMIGYAGVAAPWGDSAEKVIPYLPSYRWRQLAYAKRGKSSAGIMTKEPALEKTARVMAAMAGWPIYQIKLQYNK